jgi:hypothetical protein
MSIDEHRHDTREKRLTSPISAVNLMHTIKPRSLHPFEDKALARRP